jgi:hypothetical protein
MTAQVVLQDGSEQPLLDHLTKAHRKGTQGLSEEFLDNLHLRLHQRNGSELEHVHPDSSVPAEPGDSAEPAEPAEPEPIG